MCFMAKKHDDDDDDDDEHLRFFLNLRCKSKNGINVICILNRCRTYL